jgi:hypothetical protein
MDVIWGRRFEVVVPGQDVKTDLKELERCLKANREEYAKESAILAALVERGQTLEKHADVEITIKNLLTVIRSIDVLIPVIVVKGGEGKYGGNDVGSPADRINGIIENARKKYIMRLAKRVSIIISGVIIVLFLITWIFYTPPLNVPESPATSQSQE